MHDLTTWDKVIECGESACHGATSKELEMHELATIDAVGINSITVSEDHPGRYSISLEVCLDLCSDLSKEQVEAKLQKLQALDGEWE